MIGRERKEGAGAVMAEASANENVIERGGLEVEKSEAWMGGGIRLINNPLEGGVQHFLGGVGGYNLWSREGHFLKTQLRKVGGFVVFSHCDVLATRLFFHPGLSEY